MSRNSSDQNPPRTLFKFPVFVFVFFFRLARYQQMILPYHIHRPTSNFAAYGDRFIARVAHRIDNLGITLDLRLNVLKVGRGMPDGNCAQMATRSSTA